LLNVSRAGGWYEVFELLHRLWGQSKAREYDKGSWMQFQELLERQAQLAGGERRDVGSPS
jgi:hypothetical protein